ncbi:RNA polymerase sigma-70 factor (ECF subfamily) [Curtobacterium sp. AG1037]|uniref:RNA polymerase sigma factor n=1 Tax=Curtobacterium sp. AG1037 TaxID=2183990 RepID=UPI000E0B9B1C|nr:sigma-70 family RNA polymerase sigma factor [Curtobacterium sp. AG1037]RDH96459.1 RNA polymerase sigma-70 factor (ECF subfamily) [Curtobacterium sp. AG1037]
MQDEQDDADWSRALGGDGEAFGRVFDRHRHRVLRHCLRLVPEGSDAADTVAVVFLEAWRLRERVRLVEGSVLPWLLLTATNTARNQSRAARRYRAALDRLPPPEPVADHAERDPDGPAVRALRSLPQRDQQVLVLAVLEGYSEREVATALGLPAGTVKSRLSRARRRLAAALDTPTTPRTRPNGARS